MDGSTLEETSNPLNEGFRDIKITEFSDKALSPDFVECLFHIKEGDCSSLGSFPVLHIVACTLDKPDDLIGGVSIAAENGLRC